MFTPFLGQQPMSSTQCPTGRPFRNTGSSHTAGQNQHKALRNSKTKGCLNLNAPICCEVFDAAYKSDSPPKQCSALERLECRVLRFEQTARSHKQVIFQFKSKPAQSIHRCDVQTLNRPPSSDGAEFLHSKGAPQHSPRRLVGAKATSPFSVSTFGRGNPSNVRNLTPPKWLGTRQHNHGT